MLATAVCVSLLCATYPWVRRAGDRCQLEQYRQQLAVERQLDALTRATLAAMRQAAREVGRSGHSRR